MFVSQLFMVFGTSFVVGFSGAASPGPVLAYNIRETARRGFWAAPLISTGHSILELLVLTLLAIGVLRFMETDAAFVTVALLGSGFLLWMGWGMLRRPGHSLPAQAGRPGDPAPLEPRSLLIGGALVSLSNPFWSVWWATVGLNFMNWAQSLGLGPWGISAFYLGHILSDYTWYGAVSLALVSGRRVLTDTFYRRLILVCGLFLWGVAGFFIAQGVSRLL